MERLKKLVYDSRMDGACDLRIGNWMTGYGKGMDVGSAMTEDPRVAGTFPTDSNEEGLFFQRIGTR